MSKVFVNSIPKAGTNLVAKFLDLSGFSQVGRIGAQLAGSGFRRFLYNPFISPGYLIDLNFPVEIRKSRVDALLRKVKEWQYITAHVGYTEDLLITVRRMGFKIVVVIRDPRAVIASMVPYILKTKKHPLHLLFSSKSPEDRYRIAYEGYHRDGINLQSIYTKYMAIEPWVRSGEVLVVKF